MQPISAFRRRDLAPHRGKASCPSFVGGLIVPAEKNRVPLIVSKRSIVPTVQTTVPGGNRPEALNSLSRNHKEKALPEQSFSTLSEGRHSVR
ncbi:hypothetical protein, partial [Cronobacter sakazakii]|uniref:hypothetical protein n=1 Tax=Cronobacter sakazakii TaxID=28141 RepID=UPI002115CEC6